jgi:uncharacterized integral membrane protein
MRLIKTLIIALFFILAITFALQNQQAITINYYGLIPSFSVPLFLIAFFSILIGILIAGFGDIFVRYSLRLRARKCEKALKACQKELEALKKTQAEEELPSPPEVSDKAGEGKKSENKEAGETIQTVPTSENA